MREWVSSSGVQARQPPCRTGSLGQGIRQTSRQTAVTCVSANRPHACASSTVRVPDNLPNRPPSPGRRPPPRTAAGSRLPAKSPHAHSFPQPPIGTATHRHSQIRLVELMCISSTNRCESASRRRGPTHSDPDPTRLRGPPAANPSCSSAGTCKRAWAQGHAQRHGASAGCCNRNSVCR